MLESRLHQVPRIAHGGGTCHVMFAYDVAHSIDLTRAEAILAKCRDMDQGREAIRVTRRAPAALGYQVKPIRVVMPVEAVSVAGFQTTARCEVLAFDFGALSVKFEIPLEGSLDGLVTLSDALYENAAFQDAAKRVVECMMALLGDADNQRAAGAMSRARLDPAVEDYVVYEIRQLTVDKPATDGTDSVPDGGVDARGIVAAAGKTLAQILRAERGAMSSEEIAEALACQASYSPADAVVVDWNAAVVIDPREPHAAQASGCEDVLAVLEYANVELLEMRALDNRLDRAVDEAYARSMERTGAEFGGLGGFAGVGSRAVKHIARLQMDSAMLFEGVNNAIKLVGDQYLARVYRLAVKRFHLAERDEAIERKLGTLESLYDKLANESASKRMEILEWIVILLIASEIVLTLLGK